MALIKYNPTDYRPTSFSSFIDRFFNDEVFGGKAMTNFSPKVDIAENEKEFELQFHVPGMKKEEINIDINEDRLTVSGERKFENEKNEKNFHSVESYYGTFSRSFYLPDNVNVEKAEANYKDGILNIVIPKDKKKETKRTISIK
jgi:HSP20 family protein